MATPDTKRMMRFLTDLAEDPKLLALFKRDPGASMTAVGLTKQEQTILLSGNPQKIAKALNWPKVGPVVVLLLLPKK